MTDVELALADLTVETATALDAALPRSPRDDTAATGHRDLAQAAGVAWDTWRRDLARTGRYLMGCTPSIADAIRAGGRIPGLVLCAWWLAARAEKARAAA